MEPIPETLEALDELDADVGAAAWAGSLVGTAERARAVAPGLVGVSLALRQLDVTFTVVATDDEIATLDAVPPVSHGSTAPPDGLLSEALWQDLARESAASGVHSTLTFPVVGPDGGVVATVNLYGSGPDTFDGRHQQLAEVFGAWAPGAVTNADLSFSTRDAAERAPVQLEELALLDGATAIVAEARDIPVHEAQRQLEDAACRAGVPVIRLARVIVGLHED